MEGIGRLALFEGYVVRTDENKHKYANHVIPGICQYAPRGCICSRVGTTTCKARRLYRKDSECIALEKKICAALLVLSRKHDYYLCSLNADYYLLDFETEIIDIRRHKRKNPQANLIVPHSTLLI